MDERTTQSAELGRKKTLWKLITKATAEEGERRQEPDNKQKIMWLMEKKLLVEEV
jgi:hypothetical protein